MQHLGVNMRLRSRILLAFAFLVILAAFGFADYAVVSKLRSIRGETRRIVQDMLASVELVSRIGRDMDIERRALYRHILESDVSSMSKIEAEIEAARKDFALASAAYEPIITLPGERAAWDRLNEAVQALQFPITELLALSRANNDREARQRFRLLEPRYEEISQQVLTLIRINRAGAERQVERVAEIQRSVSNLDTELSLFGIAATLGVGCWTIYLIGKREDTLLQSSERLQVRNKELDAFAGRVSHDLRTPLTSVTLAASRLTDYAPADEPAAGILQRGVKRMDGLINDMLMLSRAAVEPSGICDPARAAAEVCDDARARLAATGGSVNLNVTHAQVRGNEGLLRQALWNLVDNAIKYRRPDVAPQIELQGRVRDERYELQLCDNGIGMDPDESRRAFEPLYRAPASSSVSGTGLGLSIVKRIIEASGGAVSIRSTPGQGTTFIISLAIVNSGRNA
jgi:signal transduction histidine kinase